MLNLHLKKFVLTHGLWYNDGKFDVPHISWDNLEQQNMPEYTRNINIRYRH